MTLRVIDAFSGTEIKRGGIAPNRPAGHRWELIDVEDRFFTARAVIRYLKDGRVVRQPLIVRFTHPKYFGRRVGFIPS